jgi:tetratricopeptide (TPR) repeat protein
MLRSIVSAEPHFLPAWGRLLYADSSAVDLSGYGTGNAAAAIRQMQSDMAKVEKIAPDLPELTLAKLMFLPATSYEQRLNLIGQAANAAPNKSEIFSDQSAELQRVGRMSDGITAARRAAELDPLSPTVTTQLIMALAYGGRMVEAREQLARAEQLWAGTDALRDALWAFNLRFGDPATALKLTLERFPALELYLQARGDPASGNVEGLIAHLRPEIARPLNAGQFGWAVQALGEFNEVEDLFGLIGRAPTEMVAKNAYLFFRPGLASMRRDPRFMTVAKRIRLSDYWRSSGNWPDFCNDPQLPYDCKAEALKHG